MTDQQSLSDVLRHPTQRPLATLMTAVILGVICWQSMMAAMVFHPAIGVLVLGVSGVSYWIAKQLWTVQRRHIVRAVVDNDVIEDSSI